MGNFAKKKGYRGEMEFAKIVKGKRVPLSGSSKGYKHDVILPNGWTVEVKRHKSGCKVLYEWLEENNGSELTDMIVFRMGEKPWLVCMNLPTFLKVMNGEKDL